jgi:hypothetical protein
MNDDERRVEDIDLWFRERGRKLLFKELPDGWEAIFPVRIPNTAVMAPGAFGKTKVDAAENAVSTYLADPHLHRDDPDPTPP